MRGSRGRYTGACKLQQVQGEWEDTGWSDGMSKWESGWGKSLRGRVYIGDYTWVVVGGENALSSCLWGSELWRVEVNYE